MTPTLTTLLRSLSTPPISQQTQSLYYIRQHYQNNPNLSTQSKIVKSLSHHLCNQHHGSLLRHEIAYILGQLGDKDCIHVLSSILQDEAECTIVRHECAEALGMINNNECKSILEKYQYNELLEIQQTCQVALHYMNHQHKNNNTKYNCKDVAMPLSNECTIRELGDFLQNPTNPIYTRYQALFSLRDKGNSECIHILGKVLIYDTSSNLLKHEIAYVLGQLQHFDGIEYLEISLRNVKECNMVRHESAEALGNMVEGRDDVKKVLREYLKDEDQVVRESCELVLDEKDYWTC